MRRFVYNAKSLFTDIERRLLSGERIVIYTCQLPNCTPSEGKVFFYRQGDGYVVGICDNNNKKNIVYHGDCRDLKWLCEHKAILFDNIVQIYNMFYRFAAEYETTDEILTYFIDGYGAYKDGKYVFEIKKVGETWRAYIVRTPSLAGRDSASAVVHQLSDSGRKYVCISGAVASKTTMIALAKQWSRGLQNYIETGQTIDEWFEEQKMLAKKKKGG
ncbi:TPA: hypothetical protein IAC10_13135 [Candidatus Scatousia excrementigallinarum]|uniref:Uncharacterized protein n=1 Tax=Candidatus Scatousia excrementigallinarum TaxID=2840935 RepID=A0A9D1F0Y6_9BACT|nr:hypothetical protein [Candidatus Scatousia excrementigallinarum]